MWSVTENSFRNSSSELEHGFFSSDATLCLHKSKTLQFNTESYIL